jgi:hypothetical protein
VVVEWLVGAIGENACKERRFDCSGDQVVVQRLLVVGQLEIRIAQAQQIVDLPRA